MKENTGESRDPRMLWGRGTVICPREKRKINFSRKKEGARTLEGSYSRQKGGGTHAAYEGRHNPLTKKGNCRYWEKH